VVIEHWNDVMTTVKWWHCHQFCRSGCYSDASLCCIYVLQEWKGSKCVLCEFIFVCDPNVRLLQTNL